MANSRRKFIQNSAALLPALGLSSFSNAATNPQQQPLKIVCVGGHPDDPESGCGGTLAKFAAAGHAVTIIYLTRGEAGISGKSHQESATIRSKEAEAACVILKTKPIFAGQVDGDTVVNNEWVKKIQDLIAAEKPNIVFTHWPIDSHKDHQAASLLTIQAWNRSGKTFDLYFFEVCAGSQTMVFKPTEYVDITSTQEQKRKAVFCHTSQNPAGIYDAEDCNHTSMEKFRGIEANVKAAEAFIRAGGRFEI